MFVKDLSNAGKAGVFALLSGRETSGMGWFSGQFGVVVSAVRRTWSHPGM